jgi:atypical dual specificity phosphatase
VALIGDIYRYFRSWFTHRPSRFGWVIDGKLAASGRLMTPGQLKWAIDKGIRSVVTIREIPLNSEWFRDQAAVKYRHVKVEDGGAPPLDELDGVVNYIESGLKDNKPVIIHCNGGSGRTSTILAAYLMKTEHLTATQATLRVKEIRGRTIRHKKQLEILKEYENIVLH